MLWCLYSSIRSRSPPFRQLTELQRGHRLDSSPRLPGGLRRLERRVRRHAGLPAEGAAARAGADGGQRRRVGRRARAHGHRRRGRRRRGAGGVVRFVRRGAGAGGARRGDPLAVLPGAARGLRGAARAAPPRRGGGQRGTVIANKTACMLVYDLARVLYNYTTITHSQVNSPARVNLPPAVTMHSSQRQWSRMWSH